MFDGLDPATVRCEIVGRRFGANGEVESFWLHEFDADDELVRETFQPPGDGTTPAGTLQLMLDELNARIWAFRGRRHP